MSIDVPISRLGAEVDRREFGYLLTVGDDARVHVIALRPRLVDPIDPVDPVDPEGDVAVFRFDTGAGRTIRNASERPAVTAVFPPVDPGGMTLIVDGVASVADEHLDLAANRAVLHRAAPPVV